MSTIETIKSIISERDHLRIQHDDLLAAMRKAENLLNAAHQALKDLETS